MVARAPAPAAGATVTSTRLSLTTMGVLPMRLARATSVTTVGSLVFSPRITSTSCMRSTGLKKCRPAKFSGRGHAFAMRVMLIVEVFDAMSPAVAMRLRPLLAYPERTAGGLMTTRVVLAHRRERVGDVRDRLAAELEIENLEPMAPRHPLGGVAQPRDLLRSWQFLAPETQKVGKPPTV